MKFKDLKTGSILVPNSKFTIEQMEKYPERYELVKDKKETKEVKEPKEDK